MTKNNHGGYREGSGRKSKYDTTDVMRVPEKYKDLIKALIIHLDDTAHITNGYQAEESPPLFFRSLKDKKQNIIFTTKPIT